MSYDEVLNIGSTDTASIATLAEVIRSELAPDPPIEHGERRAGDAEHTHTGVTKAGDVLGYRKYRPSASEPDPE